MIVFKLVALATYYFFYTTTPYLYLNHLVSFYDNTCYLIYFIHMSVFHTLNFLNILFAFLIFRVILVRPRARNFLAPNTTQPERLLYITILYSLIFILISRCYRYLHYIQTEYSANYILIDHSPTVSPPIMLSACISISLHICESNKLHVYIYKHTFVYIYVHIYMYIPICRYICNYIYMCMNICLCVNLCINFDLLIDMLGIHV